MLKKFAAKVAQINNSERATAVAAAARQVKRRARLKQMSPKRKIRGDELRNSWLAE